MLNLRSLSEEETFRRLLTQYNTGIISIVSDTDDYWNTITNIASNLKDDILARQPDSMGLCKTVFRPDSGNPIDVICGLNIMRDEENFSSLMDMANDAILGKYPYISYKGEYYQVSGEYATDGRGVRELKATRVELSENEVKGSLQILWEIFGGTINDKGFKVLNPKVGLIYGDSITPQRANDILARMAELGFAASNIVFGIGSFAYNYSTRDSLGFAIKATAAIDSDDNLIPVQKTVKTDTGKKSACGLLHVTEDLKLIDNATRAQEATGALKVIFSNGSTNFETNFAAIRERAGK